MMLTPITTPRAYRAAISATAIADPWAGAQVNYPVPQRSLGCACAQAEYDGLQRYRGGPAVPDDHALRQPGASRLMTEGESLAGLGRGLDFMEPLTLPILAFLAWGLLRR